MRQFLLLALLANAQAADDYEEPGRAGWGAFAAPPPLSVQAAHDLMPGQGLVVLHVRPGGTADSLGVAPGDIVMSLNGQPVSTRRELRAIVRQAEAGDAVRVAVKSPNAKILGTIRPKTDPIDLPAVISKTYGKGRVVYFATGFDAAYYLYPYPYQRLCLKHSIEWAANANRPVVVEAPMCVHSTVMRQTKDGERLVVHLFSDLNTTAHRALPVDDVPLREEVVPIHDIVVTFRTDTRIKRIHLEPAGKELEMHKTLRGIQVVVPRLDVHAMVVAELE